MPREQDAGFSTVTKRVQVFGADDFDPVFTIIANFVQAPVVVAYA